MQDEVVQVDAVQALKIIGHEVYPVAVFYLLYIVVVELGFLLPYSSLSGFQKGVVILATSPFSYLEAVGGTPTQTTQGLLNNFLVPAVLMLFAMLYNTSFSHRLRRFISVPSVFGISVVGTYVVSDVVWKLTPLPSTGTSIIGFCFTLSLVGAAASDLIVTPRRRDDPHRGVGTTIRICVRSLFLASSGAVMILWYLVNNPSWMIHLAGGGFSFILLYFWAEMGCPSLRALPKRLLDEPVRKILFTLIVIAAVLIA